MTYHSKLDALIKEVESLRQRVTLLEGRKSNTGKRFKPPTVKEISDQLIIKHQELPDISIEIATRWHNYWSKDEVNWFRKTGKKVSNWKNLLDQTYHITKSRILSEIELARKEKRLRDGINPQQSRFRIE